MGLMRIQKALIDDTISTKKAGLLLYSMQLAMTNVGQTTFGQANGDELVADMVDEEEAISGQHSAVDQNQHQEPFTTEGTEEKGGLPQMNADKRRWEREEIATIVMKPIPTKDLGLTLGQTHAKMG